MNGEPARPAHVEAGGGGDRIRQVRSHHRLALSRSRRCRVEADTAVARARACACEYSRTRSRRPTCPSSMPGTATIACRCCEMGVELYEVRRRLGQPDTDRGPLKSASSGAVRAAREGVRVRSGARIRRLDEFRPAIAARQHRARLDHRQPGDRAGDCGALRRDRAARKQLSGGARRRELVRVSDGPVARRRRAERR